MKAEKKHSSKSAFAISGVGQYKSERLELGDAINHLEEALGVLAVLSEANHDENRLLPARIRAAADGAFTLIHEAQRIVIEWEVSHG